MDGWLNADLVLTNSVPTETWKHLDAIFIMDATEIFPFPNDKFTYIYCEDFLEHFNQKDGLSIFAECYRVLKSGGTWRLSTPGFDQILPALNLSGRETIDFGHWNWGHKLLYTEAYTRSVLNAVGFDLVVKCEFGKSDHEILRGIDTRQNQKNLNLILEATKRHVAGSSSA